MDQGWIKLHRGLLNSPIFTDNKTLKVWIWCLLKANHETHKFKFNGTDQVLLAGQFITGREKAIKELGITAQNYKTIILYLKSTSRITSKTTNKFTIITLVNWTQYQKEGEEVTSKSTSKVNNNQTTTKQQLTTYKNDKNEKNEKKEQAPLIKKLFWNTLQCHLRDNKLIMRDNGEWKTLNESNPEACTIVVNGIKGATGHQAVKEFREFSTRNQLNNN